MAKRLLILVALMLLASPVSANADEFMEFHASVEVGSMDLYVGTNKYNGDRVYLVKYHGRGVALSVVPTK